MVRTKLTVRRWPRHLAWTSQRREVERPFKIKVTLPEQKTVNIKKGGNVIKTITVRRKANYFTDRNARTF